MAIYNRDTTKKFSKSQLDTAVTMAFFNITTAAMLVSGNEKNCCNTHRNVPYKTTFRPDFLSSACLIYMQLVKGRYSVNEFRSFFNSSERAVFLVAGQALSVPNIQFKKTLPGTQHWQPRNNLTSRTLNPCVLGCKYICHSVTRVVHR